MGPARWIGPAGWATAGSGWRTGHGAGALAVLFMLATETGMAEDKVYNLTWGSDNPSRSPRPWPPQD